MSVEFSIPDIWAKKLEEWFKKEAEWIAILEKMMPYPRGEGWKQNLNRFVENLNREHNRKLHPERYWDE